MATYPPDHEGNAYLAAHGEPGGPDWDVSWASAPLRKPAPRNDIFLWLHRQSFLLGLTLDAADMRYPLDIVWAFVPTAGKGFAPVVYLRNAPLYPAIEASLPRPNFIPAQLSWRLHDHIDLEKFRADLVHPYELEILEDTMCATLYGEPAAYPNPWHEWPFAERKAKAVERVTARFEAARATAQAQPKAQAQLV